MAADKRGWVVRRTLTARSRLFPSLADSFYRPLPTLLTASAALPCQLPGWTVPAQKMNIHLMHSGFHVHDGVRAAPEERDFAVRLARYCARKPVALGRMEYDERHSAVTYHSDKPTGPTAGSETVDALEFLARVVSHIPQQGSSPAALLRLVRIAREGYAA
jgi:hypothetical protein